MLTAAATLLALATGAWAANAPPDDGPRIRGPRPVQVVEPAQQPDAEPLPAAWDASAARIRGSVPLDQRDAKPRHSKLAQNPHTHTDFSAYTQEWGEVRIGVEGLAVGVLPRVQLSTIPLLDAVRVPNGAVKWDALRVGPLDLSASAAAYALPLGDFRASLTAPGATASLRIGDPVTLHVGGKYLSLHAHGFPDPGALPGWLAQAIGVDAAAVATAYQGATHTGTALVEAHATALHFAMDMRVNRRDSIVIQIAGLSGISANARAFIPALGVGERAEYTGGLSDTLTATISYQATFRNLDLRIGGGRSALPYAWAVQGNDLAYRFGGQTRADERRAIAAWRAGAPTTPTALAETTTEPTPTEGTPDAPIAAGK